MYGEFRSTFSGCACRVCSRAAANARLRRLALASTLRDPELGRSPQHTNELRFNQHLRNDLLAMLCQRMVIDRATYGTLIARRSRVPTPAPANASTVVDQIAGDRAFVNAQTADMQVDRKALHRPYEDPLRRHGPRSTRHRPDLSKPDSRLHNCPTTAQGERNRGVHQ